MTCPSPESSPTYTLSPPFYRNASSCLYSGLVWTSRTGNRLGPSLHVDGGVRCTPPGLALSDQHVMDFSLGVERERAVGFTSWGGEEVACHNTEWEVRPCVLEVVTHTHQQSLSVPGSCVPDAV